MPAVSTHTPASPPALPKLAISIQQPYAGLVAAGLVDVHNRSWRTDYRGPILIHASRKVDACAAMAVRCGYHPRSLIAAPEIAPFGHELEMRAGGIVGVADLVDIVEHHPSPWFEGPFGWVFANARPLPFLPHVGQVRPFTALYAAPAVTAEVA